MHVIPLLCVLIAIISGSGDGFLVTPFFDTRHCLRSTSVSKDIKPVPPPRRLLSLANRLKPKPTPIVNQIDTLVEPVKDETDNVLQAKTTKKFLKTNVALLAELEKDAELTSILHSQGITVSDMIQFHESYESDEIVNKYGTPKGYKKARSDAVKAAKKAAKEGVTKANEDTKPISPFNKPEEKIKIKTLNTPFSSEPLKLPPVGDYQRWTGGELHYAKDYSKPRYNTSIKDMLSFLIENIGFPAIYREIRLDTFRLQPTLLSSLRCLRQVDMEWARLALEKLYVKHKGISSSDTEAGAESEQQVDESDPLTVRGGSTPSTDVDEPTAMKEKTKKKTSPIAKKNPTPKDLLLDKYNDGDDEPSVEELQAIEEEIQQMEGVRV